jgi:hypothetical protein
MNLGSSQRMSLDPAPGGLGLVQDLVNTALIDEPQLAPDLLDSLSGAQTWLSAALDGWSEATGRPMPDITLTDDDLSPLRILREQARAALRTGEPSSDARSAPRIRLELRSDGSVGYEPIGEGWQAIAAIVYAELILAQAAGTAARLKICAKPSCGAAFYDRSRNSSRVWHDTKLCGNAINLRASRARRAN